jgi:hypothetical protein
MASDSVAISNAAGGTIKAAALPTARFQTAISLPEIKKGRPDRAALAYSSAKLT